MMSTLRPRALALSLLVCACSAGEDTDGSGSTPGTMTSVGTGSSSSATTGESSTTVTTTDTTVEPTTSEPTTTTGEQTTGDPTTGTTGPICEPGSVNCVCDAGMCDEGLVCTSDVCTPAAACEGDVEPDDDEPNATDLGEITDDDDDKLMADGILDGMADVDWYRYKGVDTFGHVSEPTIQVSSSATVRVCQFLECEEGAVMTQVECPQGTQSALSGMLRPGCCGPAMFAVPDFECPGTNDNLFVYVRIDQAAKDSCVEYSLNLHD